jgi:hypothetical protein
MVDKEKRETKSSSGSNIQTNTMVGVNLTATSKPELISNHKKTNTNKKAHYGEYVIWFLIALSFTGIFLYGRALDFFDKHSGAVSAVGTIAIMLLTIAYVRYSRHQWRVMEKQLALTRQQIVNSQAAILGIRFDILYRFLPGEPHGMRAIVEYRFGSAIATDIYVTLNASWKDAHSLANIGEPLHLEVNIPSISPQGTRSIVKMVPLAGLNTDTWEEIKHKIGPKTIGVSGKFRYTNGFDAVPEEHFCFIWYAHPEVLGSSLAGDFIECERYASTVEMFTAFEKKAAETKN